MTEFKPGDIVRITRGEPGAPGYEDWVRVVTSNYLSAKEISVSVLMSFEEDGWTIELVERPLPTRPNTFGWAMYQGERSLVRRDHVRWSVHVANGKTRLIADSDLSDFTEAVLIPKELADKIIEWTADPFRRGATIGGVLEQIADHLKGQDDE